MSELIQAPVEAKAEEATNGREEWEGKKAVGEVQLAVPASRVRGLHCVVYVAVVEVVVAEVVIEVAGEVDDKTRLLAVFDDDVERLDSEVGDVCGGGKFNHCTEVHVLTEAPSYHVLVLIDGRGIGVGEHCGLRQEGEGDSLSDVSFDLRKLLEVGVGLKPHEGKRGEPMLSLLCALDVGGGDYSGGRKGLHRRGWSRERDRG